MNELGYVCLILITVACFAGLALAITASSSTRRAWMRGAEGAAYAVAALAVVASVALIVALVTRDFSNEYVYEHTSRSLPLAYTVSAFWAGNAGSLLLWLLLLGIFSTVVIRQIRREDPPSAPFVVATLMAITAFFALLMLLGNDSNPFVRFGGGVVPPDGLGMNPMLLHPGMVIHPVALYLGFVGCAIPFAVAMGGLLARSPSVSWLPAVRRWALASWFFLGIGNLLGAWWAYVTLGWGGYWAWDPVENASLMPWLTVTALIHSVVMLRKRQMFRVWMVVLAIATFLLTIFGTFLTRSGIAVSVHAFSDNTFIPWFTVFLLLIVVFSVIVTVSRRQELRPEKRLDNSLSRESSFLYTNLVLAVIAFVVLWGVVFPIIAGAVRGTEVELSTNFYTVVTVPLALVLMFLMGLCPLLPWRGRDRSQVLKGAAWTAPPALIVLVVLLALGVRKPYTLLSFTLAAFAAASVLLLYGRGWRDRRKTSGTGWIRAFGAMVWNNRSRYGGFLAHLGIIIILVGITGSYAFKESADGELARGDSLKVGRFELTYEDLEFEQAADKEIARARFTLLRNGQEVGQVHPVKEYYPARDQVWTRVDLHSTLAGDVYVSLLGYTPMGAQVVIRAEINPLVGWLWIGGGVLVLGGLIVLWPLGRARARRDRASQKKGSEPASRRASAEAGADE